MSRIRLYIQPTSSRLFRTDPRVLLRSCRGYHSAQRPEPDIEGHELMDKVLAEVSNTGFTPITVTNVLRNEGYSDSAHVLFPNGVFDLVRYHLIRERNNLAFHLTPEVKELTTQEKLRFLLTKRLQANVPIADKLQEALAVMMMPANIAASLQELHLLSDEICFLANDSSPDFSWYTRRLAISSVYSSSELFMSQDQSYDYGDTWSFVDRRMDEVLGARQSIANLTEWLEFQGRAAVNVVKSQLSRG